MSNITNVKFKDKDTDDGDMTSMLAIDIESVSNGWIVKYSDDESGEDWQEVYDYSSGEEMLKQLKESLGIS